MVIGSWNRRAWQLAQASGWSRLVALAAFALAVGGGCSPRSDIEYRDVIDLVAAASESVRIAQGPVGAVASGSELLLWRESSLTFLVDLPVGATLTFSRVAGLAPGEGVRVVLDQDGRPPLVLRASGETARLPLRGARPGLSRLTLSLEGGRTAEGTAVVDGRPVAIRAPRVESLQTATIQVEGGARPGDTSTSSPQYVILYIVDTVRADHLSLYGYERDTSPALRRWARSSVVFDNVSAAAPWTRASVASILTGQHPWTHRANSAEDALADSIVTLPEVLRREGFVTAAFVTNGNVAPTLGFDQGFDHFEYLKESGPLVHARATVLHRRALDWLDAQSAQERQFLWIHATDPHAPYTPSRESLHRFSDAAIEDYLQNVEFLTEIYRTRRELPDEHLGKLRALYDAEILDWDSAFGGFMRDLEARGVLDRCLLVLVSDHGEEFFEHRGWQHSTSVHEEQIRVPMLIRPPGGVVGGRRVSFAVQHVDIMPTVLDALEATVPRTARIEGSSQAAWLHGRPRVDRRVTFSALMTRQRILADAAGWEHLKLQRVWNSPSRVEVTLYDLSADPTETEDLASRYPIAREFLQHQLSLRTGVDAGTVFAERSLDEALRSRLEALGYVSRQE